MHSVRLLAAVAALVFLNTAAAFSTNLQVQPALVDVAAPGAASTITLRNDGPAPINVQLRVFRWSQVGGKERLEPTDEVVASPPAVKLAPHEDYVARVVRVVKRPVSGEESYRLLVDELPDASAARSGTVRLLVRHSIPAFFSQQNAAPADVTWSVSNKGGQVTLTATNNGASRLRISSLTLRDSNGKKISLGAGLAGYALGGSTMRWTVPAGSRSFATRGTVTIAAQGNVGPINAVARIVSGR